MKILLYSISLFISLSVFVTPVFAAADTIEMCSWNSKDAVIFTDNVAAECVLSDTQIRIAIPFPGLPSKTYYPIKRYTTEDINGEPSFCYLREPEKCYYVGGLQDYITIIYNYAIGIVGIIAVAMVVYGGYQYILARGNSSEIEKAKETIIGSVSGIVIALLSYLILFTVNPQIVKLSIPALPATPPLEVNESEHLCHNIRCGEHGDFSENGKIDSCIGVKCSEGSLCLLERSSLSDDKFVSGSCTSKIKVKIANKDKDEDGKYINMDVEPGTYCGVLDVDYLNGDDIGGSCNDPLLHANTCYISPAKQNNANNAIVVDYEKRFIDKSEDTRYGCLAK